MNQPATKADQPQPAVGALNRWYLASYGIDRLATWITLVVALTLAYRLTGSLGVPIAIALAQLMARAVTGLFPSGSGRLWPSLVSLLGIIRVGAIAGLILVETKSDLWWAVGLLTLAALANGIVEGVHSTLLPRVAGYRGIPKLNRQVARAEQVTAIAGPLLAAGILMAYDYQTAFSVAAVVAYISLLLVRRLQGRVAPVASPGPEPSYSSNPFYNNAWTPPVDVRNVVAGLVVVAALAAVVRLTLLDAVFGAFGQDEWVYGLLVAIVAVGALVGPPPMDKVLSHFPVVLVSAGAVGAVAVGALMVGIPVPIYLAIPVLLGLGLVFVTLDTAARITFRRSIPEHRTDDANRSTRNLIFVAQAVSLLALLLISDLWGIRGAALMLSILGIVLVGVNFLQSGGVKAMERVVAPSRETPGGGSGA